MIRLGIIGCGRIIELGHAPAIKELARSARAVALADVAEANLKQIGEMLKVSPDKRYQDYRELLRRERKNVDVVVLALPHKLHKPILIASAEAGYAILTE